MKQPLEGLLVRIYLGESDHYEGRPVYERIVQEAHALGLAGATVLRGMMGYGAGSRIHTTKVLRLAEELPVVVEVVDTEDNIQRLLPFLDRAVEEGLVTMEKVRILKYRSA
jgi:PII-like signaling protein